MLKSLNATIFILLFLNAISFGQKFPDLAMILDRTDVTPNRELVLWMINPKVNPRSPDDDLYTCPDETRGHYYSGKANVSLIDTKTKKIINTLEIQNNEVAGIDSLIDLPYRIHRGYYEVPEINEKKEGKPLILSLKDYNNDGKSQEFALFDAVACMGLQTTLIGYSEKQDKVIQYQTQLTVEGETSKDYWVDYFFGQTPDKNGVFKYEIDYRGRGGYLEKYEIRYDKEREMFYGSRTSIADEEERPSK